METAEERSPGRGGIRRAAAAALLIVLAIAGFFLVAGRRPEVRQATGDLASLVRTFAEQIPGEGSGGYDEPTAGDIQRMVGAFRDIQAGNLQRAAEAADASDYDVVSYTDTASRRRFVLLMERRNEDGSFPHGWGLYVYSPGSVSGLTVEVPHPDTDRYSEMLGLSVFMRSAARSLFIAGANRNADGDGTADVAHLATSVFAGIHESALRSSSGVFQPHGFDAESVDYGDIVVSSGTAVPSDLATQIADGFSAEGYSVCLFDGTNCSDLGATTNVEGISAGAAGVPFVHAEFSLDIRESADARDMVAGVVASIMGAPASPSP